MVMTLFPTGSAVVEYVAVPFARVAVPSGLPLLKKLTVPVGVPLVAEATCTVTVKFWPCATLVALKAIVEVTDAWLMVSFPFITDCWY
jgi:hypothetical protein